MTREGKIMLTTCLVVDAIAVGAIITGAGPA